MTSRIQIASRRAERTRALLLAVAETAEVATPQRRRERRAVGSFGRMDNERDPHDCYETPAEAVNQLVTSVWHEGTQLHKVWDPSCGRGAIVKALHEQRHVDIDMIVGTDRYAYEPLLPRQNNLSPSERRYEISYGSLLNFTEGNYLTQPPASTTAIVMNPPYKLSDEHVRHALKLMEPTDGIVCALLRLTWMAANKRADLLEKLSHIIICGRLKMLPPDVQDQGHSGTVDFAWFVFTSRNRHGAATRIIRA